MTCSHEEFSATVGVHRLTSSDGGPVTSYMAEFRITCAQCGLPFEFQGLEPGVDLRGATVSIDNQEAHLAIVPHGTEATPLDLIGFTIRGHQS